MSGPICTTSFAYVGETSFICIGKQNRLLMLIACMDSYSVPSAD